MENRVSQETESRIRALCRQISVAHNLDEEIQTELHAHMEDKLLGYLSGEEKVTEEDAFILVREHFGDPAVIRALLREAHAVDVRVGLWKKFVMFYWAGAISATLYYVLQVAIIGIFVMITAATPVSDSARMRVKLLLAGTGIVWFLILWYILLIWGRKLQHGTPPWFIRRKFSLFREVIPFWILAVFVFIIIGNIFNVVLEYSQNSMLLRIFDPNDTTKDLEVVIRLMKGGAAVVFNATLIWWMTWPSRSFRSLLNGIGCIVISYALFQSVGLLFVFFANEQGNAGEMIVRNLRNIRNSWILLVAVIGVYLIYHAYRRTLDRKLERIG